MITPEQFKQRRQQLMTKMPKRSLALFAAAPVCIRNGDSHYPYRQSSDFYYLSGLVEPEAVMVLLPDDKQTILFSLPHDPVKELWDGSRVGQDGAVQHYRMDHAFNINELDFYLSEWLQKVDSIYYPLNHCPELEKRLQRVIAKLQQKQRSGASVPKQMINSDDLLHEMRLHKTVEEIALMQKSIDISVIAHMQAMQQCRPGMYEYQLEAILLQNFYHHGCRSAAYNSIVGSGANSCTLHYCDNDAVLKANDLVLIDAGAEFEYYAADITRTFPVNGRYAGEQKAIYELVLQAQLVAIADIKPGYAYNKINQTVIKVLTQGLLDLGLLQGEIEGIIESKAYQQFYPHSAGHWLGLDVHDVGVYKRNNQWRPLEAGMVLTVEPGIYIRPAENVDEKWWNIGVRIEDDVLVTENAAKVLSYALPKTMADVEHLMAGKKYDNRS